MNTPLMEDKITIKCGIAILFDFESRGIQYCTFNPVRGEPVGSVWLHVAYAKLRYSFDWIWNITSATHDSNTNNVSYILAALPIQMFIKLSGQEEQHVQT